MDKKYFFIFFVSFFFIYASIADASDVNEELCDAEFHTKKEDQQILRNWQYLNGARYELVISSPCTQKNKYSTRPIIFLRTFILDRESSEEAKLRLNKDGFVMQIRLEESNHWWVSHDGVSVSRIMTTIEK